VPKQINPSPNNTQPLVVAPHMGRARAPAAEGGKTPHRPACHKRPGEPRRAAPGSLLTGMTAL